MDEDQRPIETALRERLARHEEVIDALHDRVARLQARVGALTDELVRARTERAREAAARLMAEVRAEDAEDRLVNFEVLGPGGPPPRP